MQRWRFLSTHLNDRFTALADLVSTLVGMWFWSALSLVLLLLWVGWGILLIPHWFTASAWNFPLNTITTVGEWFMEGLIAAAANRVERRSRQQIDRLEQMEQRILDRLMTERTPCPEPPSSPETSSSIPAGDASTSR
jgi:ABC-type multidrug transport system fused ATPase/permease subunit